jgi:hypothetical protein
MKTAVSILPVFAAWHVMGRPLPYIQISRWSLSLQMILSSKNSFSMSAVVLVVRYVGCLAEINSPFREVEVRHELHVMVRCILGVVQ